MKQDPQKWLSLSIAGVLAIVCQPTWSTAAAQSSSANNASSQRSQSRQQSSKRPSQALRIASRGRFASISRCEGTCPFDRGRTGYVPARSTIGMAHPSAGSDPDRDRWRWLDSAVGRPCSSNSQGRCCLDSGGRQALAWCNAHYRHDTYRDPGAAQWSSGEMAGTGYGRAVPPHEMKYCNNRQKQWKG